MGLPGVIYGIAKVIEYVFKTLVDTFTLATAKPPTSEGGENNNNNTPINNNNTTNGPQQATPSFFAYGIATTLGVTGTIMAVLAVYMFIKGIKKLTAGLGCIAWSLFILMAASGTLILMYSQASNFMGSDAGTPHSGPFPNATHV